MNASKVNKVDDDILIKALKFFISGNIAFNQADNPYFQELIQTAHGNANQQINRKNIWERLKKLASTVKEDLMISLMENESKISLALDCWSSKNGYAFLGKLSLILILPLSFSFIAMLLLYNQQTTNYSYYCSLDW